MPEANILSIRIAADGFCFSFQGYTTEGESCFSQTFETNALLPLAANMKQALRSPGLDGIQPEQVDVLTESDRMTLAPRDGFEEGLAEPFFHHSLTRQDNEAVLYNLPGENCPVVIYGMDAALHAVLAARFPQARFRCHISLLLEQFHRENKRKGRREMLCHVGEHSMLAAAMDGGQLLLCNVFPCSDAGDRLYYLLSCWKQLGFDQQRDVLLLSGGEKDALRHEVEAYVKNVEDAPFPGERDDFHTDTPAAP